MSSVLTCVAFALVFFAPWLGHSAQTQDPAFLIGLPEVKDVKRLKELHVEFGEEAKSWRQAQVFAIARLKEDPEKRGWYDLVFVGRAAVVRSTPHSAELVLYKNFQGEKVQEGDRLLDTGDPISSEESDEALKEVLSILERDAEVEDYYVGMFALKYGYTVGTIDSTSSANGQAIDTNSFKKASPVAMTTVGVRWWFDLAPKIGASFDYSYGTIPTSSFLRTIESSKQTVLNPALLYRSRFLLLPAIYSLSFPMSQFKTTNTDDLLLSSSYSGPAIGVTFFYPYRFELVHLGPFRLNFHHIEAGFNYGPSVSVTDEVFKRGASVSGKMLAFNAGLEFNLGIKGIGLLDRLFIVLEAGQQAYSLDFTGATSGPLPPGASLPSGGSYWEKYGWYGVRLKLQLPDIIGGLINVE